MTLEWKPPVNDGGARVKAYHVQIKEDTPKAMWEEVANVDPYTTQYIVAGLDVDKKYKFGVSAENEVGVGELCVADKSAAPRKTVSK